ncbi:MAG: ATP-binding protein [Aestuariivirgaceae bacterium]|nr:ATP-binding protein [Aestuariivirgaceae bacterium]
MQKQLPPKSTYWHISRFLERWMPSKLYARSLIIVIAPMVLLQTIMTAVIMERHWDNVTKALSRSVAREVAFVTTLYENSPKDTAAVDALLKNANETLDLVFTLERGSQLPQISRKPFYSLLDIKLTQYLEARVGRPLVVDTLSNTGLVNVHIELEKGVILRFATNQARVYASSTPIFLLWLLGSSIVLVTLAVVFLRNQIRPILELANAAQNFGMGREVPDFHPRGAAEVRAAADSFLNMKKRIERHVEQRTTMLAGVSHDLRTILTRFKLELAFLGDTEKVKDLREDVAEMQRMLEGYIAFVKGDGGERGEMTDVSQLLESAADMSERGGTSSIERRVQPAMTVPVKPDALRRCVGNLLANAARFAKSVKLAGRLEPNQLVITVDDDGPGIPAAMREDVFKPFVRLDDARNLDETGTGLGLAIAQDIAHAHGGQIVLEDSPLGGLRAVVTIPV